VDAGAADTAPQAQSFKASLTPLQEVQDPPVTSSGSGSATCTLSADRVTLQCTITYSLGNAPTAAHIHGPAPAGQTAAVLFPFTPPLTSPTTQSATLTSAQATDLESGNYYINFHTDPADGGFSNGEIRGQ